MVRFAPAALAASVVLLVASAQAADPPLENPDAWSTLGVAPFGDEEPMLCLGPPIGGRTPGIAGPVYAGDTTMDLGVAAYGLDLDLRAWFWAPTMTFDTLPATVGNQNTLATAVPGSPYTAVVATHYYGGLTIDSPPVEIRSVSDPSDLANPRVAYTPDEAHLGLVLHDVYPGALVTVTDATSGLSASAAATDDSFVSVPLTWTPTGGDVLDITQTVDGYLSATTSVTVDSGSAAVAMTGDIPFVVEENATVVPVSGVAPGSNVQIIDYGTGAVVGERVIGGTMGHVPVCPSTGNLRVRVENGTSVSTSWVFPREPNFDAYYAGSYTEDDCVLSNPESSSGSMRVHQWIPDSDDDPPVVFLMHGVPGSFGTAQCDYPGVGYPAPGSHPQSDSYLGFDYLGRHLAHRGIQLVTFSVEMSAASMWVSATEDYYEEAVHSYMAAFPALADNPILLAGHSVGGETAIAATDDLSGVYDVRGTVAFAPTSHIDDGNASYEIVDGVPLLLLVAEEDGFFNSAPAVAWMPVSHYDRYDDDVYMVQTPGAAHAWFNECWQAADHADDPHIDRTAQEELIEKAVGRFADARFTAWKSDWHLVSDLDALSQPRGAWSYRQRYAWKGGARLIVDDYDDTVTHVNELGLPNTTIGGGGSASEITMATLEPLVSPFGPEEYLHLQSTRGARLDWTGASFFAYRLELGQLDVTDYDALTFDVMVIEEDEGTSLNRAHVPADFKVWLYDTDGDGATVPGGLPHDVDYPFAALSDPDRLRQIFETVTIPLSAFEAANPDLDLTKLDRIVFVSGDGNTASVLIDQVEFRDFQG